MRSYYPYLDASRALAVILVFWVHFVSLFAPQWQDSLFGELSIRLGHEGVNIFFVLSGYLLYQAFLKRPDQPILPYLKKRAWRIFPAYWLVLLVYLVLVAFGMSNKSIVDANEMTYVAVTNALLLSPVLGDDPIVSVSWTLTFEWVWYTLLPLAFFCRHHQFPVKMRLLLLLALAVLSGGYWGYYGGPEQFSLFFWGAILAEITNKASPRIAKNHPLPALLASIFLIANAVLLHKAALFLSIQLSGIGWLLFLWVAIERTASPGRIMTPFISVGLWSYSFYLLHSLVLHVLHKFMPAESSLAVVFLLGLSGSIMASYLCYRVIELPGMRLSQKQQIRHRHEDKSLSGRATGQSR